MNSCNNIIYSLYSVSTFSGVTTASFLMATANSSVASPKSFAKGKRATKLSRKVQPSPQSHVAEAAPNGTKTSRSEKGDQKISHKPRSGSFRVA